MGHKLFHHIRRQKVKLHEKYLATSSSPIHHAKYVGAKENYCGDSYTSPPSFERSKSEQNYDEVLKQIQNYDNNEITSLMPIGTM